MSCSIKQRSIPHQATDNLKNNNVSQRVNESSIIGNDCGKRTMSRQLISKMTHFFWQEESNRIIKRYETLNVGEAVYTSGGSLSCRYVIHTVGPEWYNHRKDMSRFHLRQVCFHTLSLAVKLNLYFHCPPGHQLWYFRHAKRHLCWSYVFDNKRIQFEVRRQV